MPDDLGTPHLRFERRGPLGWCVIDRPETRNALTPAMYFGIRRAVDLVNHDPHLAALIVTGVDDVFAPGGDLRDEYDDRAEVAELIGSDVVPFTAMMHSRAPVVCAVNGICQGGGLLLAAACDVAVASDRATFRTPELTRGVADAWYAALLPPLIGVARTRDLLLTARRIDAAEAHAMGLVARVVPHEQLEAAAEQVAGEILRTAPTARYEFKRMLEQQHFSRVDTMTFDASLEGPEVREGFLAFLERRRPSWVPEDLDLPDARL